MTEVTISERDLLRLERAQDKLNALEAGGVDKWVGYDESLKEYNKELVEEDFISDVVDSMNDLLMDAEVDFPAGHEAGPSVHLPYETMESFIKLILSKYKELELSDECYRITDNEQ